MFDMLDRPKVWIPVYWPGLAPSEKEGEVAKTVEHRIDVLVEIVERKELIALFGLGEPEDGDKREKLSDFDLFKRVAHDWRKVVASGNPVPFADDNIQMMLRQNSFPTAFTTAYLSACAGVVEIREGN